MQVVAINTFRVAGTRELVTKGHLYDADAAVVKANPSLFEKPEEHQKRTTPPKDTNELGERSMSARKKRSKLQKQVDEVVEQATAAPGEKRATRKKK